MEGLVDESVNGKRAPASPSPSVIVSVIDRDADCGGNFPVFLEKTDDT